MPVGGFERAPGGVFEGLAGRQHRLFTDDAGAFHFFDVVQSVGDDPVAAEELDGFPFPGW